MPLTSDPAPPRPSSPSHSASIKRRQFLKSAALAGSGVLMLPKAALLGAVAPRRLVYAHEFAWNEAADPVWPRLRKVYELYGLPDHLAATHGSGSGLRFQIDTSSATLSPATARLALSRRSYSMRWIPNLVQSRVSEP